MAPPAAITHTRPASEHTLLKKPNILVIMGDDIGYRNISAYNRGQRAETINEEFLRAPLTN
jgi:arylsulfatase A-like enzyme